VRYANGTDLRDLYRPGTGLTFRRLKMLVTSLPPNALVWLEQDAAAEKAKIPTPDKIKSRQEYWKARGN
jgi:hypothetical protein